MSFMARFLGTSEKGKGTKDPKSVQVLLEELAPLEEETARELACFAYVLGRIASADQSVSAEEEVAIRELLETRGKLPYKQAELVTEVALREARQMGGTQDYLVTRQLQTLLTRPRRAEILDCLIALAAADGSICTQEEDELKQIARQLGFQTKEFLEALSRYGEYRSVLKGLGS